MTDDHETCNRCVSFSLPPKRVKRRRLHFDYAVWDCASDLVPPPSSAQLCAKQASHPGTTTYTRTAGMPWQGISSGRHGHMDSAHAHAGEASLPTPWHHDHGEN